MKSLPTGLKDKLPSMKGKLGNSGSAQADFSGAKTKAELMKLYAVAVKKQPKNKEKLLDAYLKRLIEISKN